MDHLQCGLIELKLAGASADDMTFSGYGAVFGNVDTYGDVIAKGAFMDTIKEAKASGLWPAMLSQHGGYGLSADDNNPIGVYTEMREDEKLKNFIAGIEATQREVDKVFAGHGISRIASTGLPLDPNQHQAMLEIPSNEVEPGTIVQEMQAGYMLKDRLLRPAMVAVAKKPD